MIWQSGCRGRRERSCRWFATRSQASETDATRQQQQMWTLISPPLLPRHLLLLEDVENVRNKWPGEGLTVWQACGFIISSQSPCSCIQTIKILSLNCPEFCCSRYLNPLNSSFKMLTCSIKLKLHFFRPSCHAFSLEWCCHAISSSLVQNPISPESVTDNPKTTWLIYLMLRSLQEKVQWPKYGKTQLSVKVWFIWLLRKIAGKEIVVITEHKAAVFAVSFCHLSEPHLRALCLWKLMTSNRPPPCVGITFKVQKKKKKRQQWRKQLHFVVKRARRWSCRGKCFHSSQVKSLLPPSAQSWIQISCSGFPPFHGSRLQTLHMLGFHHQIYGSFLFLFFFFK